MKIATFHELFVHQLKDLYDAEHRILEALPALMEEATNEELKKAFDAHIDQTKKHVARLEDIFEMLDEKAERKTCEGIKGLIEEGEEAISSVTVPEIMDCALIASAQKVEHYEISGYGTARAFARMMGHDEVADLLQETLEEESETDDLLTEIAESTVNPIAMDEASGMRQEEEEEVGAEI